MLEWGRTTAKVTTITRDGMPVAAARRAALRGDMHVDVGDAQWLFYAGSGELRGERSGSEQPTLHAVRPHRGRHTWDVRADEVQYRMQRSSFLGGRFVVRRDDTDVATGTARRFRRASLAFDTTPRGIDQRRAD